MSVNMCRVQGSISEAGQASLTQREPTIEAWALGQIKPLEFRPRNAEAAKALATETAKSHEDRYEREQAVRQMWRTMVGEDTPGLEAEIAKMRATVQAKNRYREWELEYQQKHGRRVTPQTATMRAAPQDDSFGGSSSQTLKRPSTSAFKFDRKTFFATSDWLLGVGERPEYTKHLVRVSKRPPAQRGSKGPAKHVGMRATAVAMEGSASSCSPKIRSSQRASKTRKSVIRTRV